MTGASVTVVTVGTDIPVTRARVYAYKQKHCHNCHTPWRAHPSGGHHDIGEPVSPYRRHTFLSSILARVETVFLEQLT